MKKIALIGGAFDPIHTGHERMAIHTFTLKMFDQIWIQPCYKSGWGKDMTDSFHRLNMCAMAVAKIREKIRSFSVRLSNYEIKNKITGRTYEILEQMKNDFPDTEFSLVIGQDNADNIDKWERYEEIINMYQFVVMARHNKEPKEWYLKKPHVYVQHKIPDISSTLIRDNISKHWSMYSRYLDSDVLIYMNNCNLYGI